MLVVPLDRHRQAYRYHRLLRDMLRDELEVRDPGAAAEVGARAAAWCAGNDDRSERDRVRVHSRRHGPSWRGWSSVRSSRCTGLAARRPSASGWIGSIAMAEERATRCPRRDRRLGLCAGWARRQRRGNGSPVRSARKMAARCLMAPRRRRGSRCCAASPPRGAGFACRRRAHGTGGIGDESPFRQNGAHPRRAC